MNSLNCGQSRCTIYGTPVGEIGNKLVSQESYRQGPAISSLVLCGKSDAEGGCSAGLRPLTKSGQGVGPYQACFPVRAAQVLSQAADDAGQQTKDMRAAPPLNGEGAANGCYSKRQRASPALAAPRSDVALGRNCGWFGGMGGPELGAGSVLRPLIPALTPRKPTHPAPLPQHGYAASLAAPHPLLPRR